MRKSVHMRTDKFDFKFRVSGFVIQDNKVLFVDMDNSGFLCLPGGYVEIGETSEEAMIRELKEEINLNFKIDSFMGVIENFFTNLKKQRTHGIDFYYKVSLVDNNDYNKIDYDRTENDKEGLVHHHFKWINLDELKDCNLLPKEIKNEIINNKETFHIIIRE